MNKYILAFDTSTDQLAIGIGTVQLANDTDQDLIATIVKRGIKYLDSLDKEASRCANTQLLPSVQLLLEQHQIQPTDMVAIVCGLGPGSFTGVRIALATAKGISRGLGVPLYGVSTLDVVAWGAWRAGQRGNLCVLGDAMRHEVYPMHFNLSDDGAHQLDKVSVIKAEEFAANLEIGYSNHTSLSLPDPQPKSSIPSNSATATATSTPTTLCGDALKKYIDLFTTKNSNVVIADQSIWMPTGRGLLLAFTSQCQQGLQGTGEAGLLLPIYTRLSDAEENERKRLVGGGAITQGAAVDLPRSGVSELAAADSIQYRPVASGDVEALAALEELCFPPVRRGSGECWSAGSFASSIAQLQQSWWSAWQTEELLGFVGGRMVDGTMEILDVAVHPDWRRQGISKKLLSFLLDDARSLGAQTIELEVRASNTSAIELYKKQGFIETGRRPSYYMATTPKGEREDALLLTLELGQWAGPGIAGSPPSPLNRTDIPHNPPLILAIETSCDETAAAIIDGSEQIQSNIIASQVDFHARFGGVVPEIASRKHTEAIVGVVDEAMDQAGLSCWQELDAIAVTYAPGLIGALVVGVAFAKGLSWATGLPLIRVNHLEGHIYANRFAIKDQAERVEKETESPNICNPLSPPFVVALLSGGHTMLVLVRDWGDYEVLGSTLDDAVGEAFDKVAKALGLGYPGGPVISRLAAEGNPQAIDFPRALLHSHGLDFSLSGLKTAVITWIRQEQDAGRNINLPDVTASFQQAVIDVQVAKALAACQQTGSKTFCLGGGVAANPALREAYKQRLEREGIQVVFPPLTACTDNAAMIALVALDRYAKGKFMPLNGDAAAHADLSAEY
ncbi:MAG: tRNA (adenosine(37)-N6)-threonylcarbamoyltransferase complex transferase subunit TsaD [Coriobacteriales bacterium]|jgi:N6-L-threonylcarbamoyladenine synthase|nr:tRNA (adenosine(37)-N6)-threonylcarbamoyltransferase complex transferase subunit TsaD [Coriobacteriales bacterium]